MTKLPILLLSCFALFLAGCGQQQSNESQTTAAADGAIVTDGGPALKFVTFRYLVQDQEIIKAFEDRYRVKVDVEVLPVREIILRAQDDRLRGDVVLAPSIEDITRIKNFNQLQPFFVDIFSKGNVDDRYLDDQGYYAGVSRWTMAAVYNPNAVAIDEVRTYKGLAQLPGRGIRLGLAHPDSSGIAATIGGIARIVNDQAAALWTKIIYESAEGGMSGSDYQQLDRMLAGDLDIAFVSSGAALRWFLNGDPNHFAAAEAWRVKYPHTETDQVNFFNMTCVGMLRDSPNRTLALRFINHLFQKENQEKIGDAIFEYPNEAFSLTNDYLMGVYDTPGRAVAADELEDRLPLAWGIINRLAGEQSN